VTLNVDDDDVVTKKIRHHCQINVSRLFSRQVSGTLSDTVGIVSLDRVHQQERQRIINQHHDGGSEHLFAGFKGLLHGFMGGITSIPLQTWTGAREEGPQASIDSGSFCAVE